LSVFCSTTLDIGISNAHAQSIFAEIGHSQKNPIRAAGEVQYVGERPWISRATVLRPDAHR
jgi:hypothetical protein